MRRKDLTTNERNLAVQFLLIRQNNGKLIHGAVNEAAAEFAISRRTVSRIWAEAKKKRSAGQMIVLKSAKMNAPRKKKIIIDIDLIKSLSTQKRASIRRLAVSIGCKKTTVARWITQGLIKAHTSALKPDLTAPNKLLRIRFSLEAIEFDRILNILKFRSMYNTVHIDEKWFQITKPKQRVYLAADEEEPHRTCKNKGFIPKIMFMCAVCRPLFANDGSVLFDGKIGIFPFTEEKEAQRGSKNRPAGTLITKPIDSITKQVIKACMINEVRQGSNYCHKCGIYGSATTLISLFI